MGLRLEFKTKSNFVKMSVGLCQEAQLSLKFTLMALYYHEGDFVCRLEFLCVNCVLTAN